MLAGARTPRIEETAMRHPSIRLLTLGALLFVFTQHGRAASEVQAWVTTADRSRLLKQETLPAAVKPARTNRVEVDPSRRYQSMVGFGAAVTDASAWLIQTRLNEAQRAALLADLFGRDGGIGLSFTRITIGASDFSRSHYSLGDTPDGAPDPDLAHFSIEPTRAELLPVLRAARVINPELRIVASPWSPPGWMKTSGGLVHGRLRADAQPAFAAYLVRFSDAFAAAGVPIYALTLQNEPDFDPPDYPGMRLEPAERARIIREFLGPMLAKRTAPPLILDWDHNWDKPESPLEVLSDREAARFIAGVAWHCYAGNVSAQTRVHEAYPDKDAYFTECSGGEWDPVFGNSLRWMVRELIIGSTRGWARGIVLWNLALDEQHGPHAGGCGNCRGVVTIDSSSGTVTRNVEYYALAHASRFVRPGAHRIESSSAVKGLATVAFQNTDGSLALIALNDTERLRGFSVNSAGATFDYALPAGAVATFVWTPPGLKADH